MKANELRLGNWVLAEGNPYKIKHISPDDEWEPIPLTPEILGKAGFAEDEYCLLRHPHLKCRWVTKNMSGINLDTPFLRFDAIGRLPFISSDVYYLHQLQNLYFALTGTELEINLK